MYIIVVNIFSTYRMLTQEKLRQAEAALNELEKFRTLSQDEKELIINDILGRTYIDLRCDWALKWLLADDAILTMLLQDFLPGMQITSVERIPNELPRMADDKNIIMDVLCKTESGAFVVEMQREKKTSFQNRMVYYGASMIHHQLKPGDGYEKLVPVYVLCFMDYTLHWGDDRPIHRYGLRERDSGEAFGDQLWIYLCDLKTFGKQSIDGLSPEESWLYLLKNMANFAGEPEEMGTKYAVVAEASRMYHLPDKEQIQYLFAMVSEHEKLDIGTAYYKDGFFDGHKLGKEEGWEEGRVEGKAEEKDAIARTMLAKGLPVALIIECTGLTEDEVKSIGAKKEELK